MFRYLPYSIAAVFILFITADVRAQQTGPGRLTARYNGQITINDGTPLQLIGVPDSMSYTYSGTRRNYDMATTYTVDTVSHTYHITAYETHTYTAGDSLLTDIYQMANNGTAVNYSRNSYAYDAAGNDTLYTAETWNTATSAWVNSNRSSYTYNVAGQKTGWLLQSWDAAGNVWRNDIRHGYEYDALGNDTTDVRQNWNTSANSWKNISYTKTVLTSFNKIGYIKSQRWNDTAAIWKDSFMLSNYYNGSNQLLASAYGPIYAGTITVLDSIYNIAMNTAGSPLTRILYQKDVSGSFNNPYRGINRYIYTYDAAGHVLTNEIDYLDANFNSVNSMTGMSQYNSAGQITLDGSVFQIDQGTFGRYHKVYYYEQSTTSVGNQANAAMPSISIYPSPAARYFTVAVDKPLAGAITGTICDITGKTWKQWSGLANAGYSRQVDVSDLPAGLYNVRLSGSGFTGSKMIVVVH